MTLTSLASPLVAYIAIAILSMGFLSYFLRARDEDTIKQISHKELPERTVNLINRLQSILPENVITRDDTEDFTRSMKVHWAHQIAEVPPACVVRPRNAEELSSVVKVLKREFDERNAHSKVSKERVEGIFAIRSGGHSGIANASSIHSGVLIDLSLISEITLSDDGTTVLVGSGALTVDVYKVLEKRGLSFVAGRHGTVGVGGIALGGGISFFTPRHGLVCSNIISYELVLASGDMVTASQTTNPDLWRALKGGANNFGIVTRMTCRTFLQSPRVWGGWLWLPPFQEHKTLAAFHEFVDRADSTTDASTRYDEDATGLLVAIGYIHQLGIRMALTSMVHLAPPENPKEWPGCWKSSGFASLWRFRNTCKHRTLANTMEELTSMSEPDKRQYFATTTLRNDLATLKDALAIHRAAVPDIKRRNVKNMVWTFMVQPLLPAWYRKGDPNPMGLGDSPEDEPLVLVCFTQSWMKSEDDEFVQNLTRRVAEEIDEMAKTRGTYHPFRYANYAAGWQRVMEGYGEENLEFLRGVSRRVDPEGLFQRGCAGGFKLWRDKN